MDAKEQPYKLYYLVCPSSREIRYVGVTKRTLEIRLSGHLNNLTKPKDHKTNWIRSLVRKGLKPEINLLQTFATESDVLAAEVYWIGYFKSVGCRLTNSCAGGKGVLNPSDATRQKKSEANKGQVPWCKGKAMRSETRKKISETLKGRKVWIEGKTHSPETKQKISNTKMGKPSVKHWKAILCTTTGAIFQSLAEAAKVLGMKHTARISKVLSGELNHTGGYHFQYLQTETIPNK